MDEIEGHVKKYYHKHSQHNLHDQLLLPMTYVTH